MRDTVVIVLEGECCQAVSCRHFLFRPPHECFVFLSGVPRHLDSQRIREDLLKLDDVQSVDELNVWALTTDKTAALVHLQLGECSTTLASQMFPSSRNSCITLNRIFYHSHHLYVDSPKRALHSCHVNLHNESNVYVWDSLWVSLPVQRPLVPTAGRTSRPELVTCCCTPMVWAGARCRCRPTDRGWCTAVPTVSSPAPEETSGQLMAAVEPESRGRRAAVDVDGLSSVAGQSAKRQDRR